MVSELRILERPELRRPLLITAFAGWNDAGSAATGVIRYMLRRWRSDTLAEIDPEPFYDFTQARPTVRIAEGERVIEWPQNRFSWHRVEGADRDLILLSGIEPHLGWQSYVGCVLELCRTFEVSGVITLGALLAEVSHVRPVPLIGSSADEELARRLDLGAESASRYEGPTGVVGVLSQSVRDAGLATASLWASVPFYVNASPNPKGALAMLERLNGGLELGLSLHDLEVFAARFDAQVQAEVDKDPQMVEYARRIEEQLDELEDDEGAPGTGQPPAELPDAGTMVEELERFLREQRDS